MTDSSTNAPQILPSAQPLPWRKTTPLHAMRGARVIRYAYQVSAAPTAPQLLHFRYDSAAPLDRIIGFGLTFDPSSTTVQFLLQDLNTGWRFPFSYLGTSKGVTIAGNVETLSDEANLQWSFSAAPAAIITLSFFNIEHVPVIIT